MVGGTTVAQGEGSGLGEGTGVGLGLREEHLDSIRVLSDISAQVSVRMILSVNVHFCSSIYIQKIPGRSDSCFCLKEAGVCLGVEPYGYYFPSPDF
ncbi:MAG: hypothetical protein DRJ47_11320 [Thermoprotei archaeon]|nr:MAG: hypothetical protein DRJ47_11320 [Thermoprotei archaeon]